MPRKFCLGRVRKNQERKRIAAKVNPPHHPRKLKTKVKYSIVKHAIYNVIAIALIAMMNILMCVIGMQKCVPTIAREWTRKEEDNSTKFYMYHLSGESGVQLAVNKCLTVRPTFVDY